MYNPIMLALISAFACLQVSNHFSWKGQSEYRFLFREWSARDQAALDRLLSPKNGWEAFASKTGERAYMHDQVAGKTYDLVGFINPKLVKPRPRLKFEPTKAMYVAVTGNPPYLAPILKKLHKHGVGWKVAGTDRDKYDGATGHSG
jgi:hypothetical protein